MAQQYRDSSPSRSNEDRSSRYGSRGYEAGDDSDQSWSQDASSRNQWESSGGMGDARDYGRSDRGYGRPERGQFGAQGDSYYGSPSGERQDRDWQGQGRDWREGRYTSQESGRTSPYYGPGDRGYGQYGQSHPLQQDSGQRWGQSAGNYGSQRGYGQQNYGQQGYGRGYGDEYGQTSRGQGSGYGYGSRSMGQGMNQGSGHRGKGPKGYQRSDERLKEVICEMLTDDASLDASNITITVKGGEVTLEGSVNDRHSKHRAEDLVDDCSGVKEVRNNLRVEKSAGSWDEDGGARSSSSLSASDSGNGRSSSTPSSTRSATGSSAQQSRPS